ncbi:hypothetical protein KH5_18640 [Urechidicola sp. KH5]
MSVKFIDIEKTSWHAVLPTLRYVLGTCLIIMVTTLLNYPLSYLASVLALSFMSPGTRPLKFKDAVIFLLFLSVFTGFAYVFSAYFIDYPLVFMPLLLFIIFCVYYTQKLPLIIKLFAIISLLMIPLLALNGVALGGFVAISLVFNTLLAIGLTQLMFRFIPYSEYDAQFEKQKGGAGAMTPTEQFKYAARIVLVLLPIILLFFIFNLSGGALVLVFSAILSISPALSNPKTGLVMIVANIIGGLFAIIGYKLLTVVPMFSFMLLLVLLVGLLFSQRLFSKTKTAAVFGTAFSTFLLILLSVTSSDAEAGSKLWDRLIQISAAVIYVVLAFRFLNSWISYISKQS